ncbi:hypothetical protein BH09VER1_BH09VER1_06760 [soil metagenome]
MATKKKAAPAKKSTSKAKATSVKKKVAAKASPTKASTKPTGPREQAIATSALKLVDEAAAALRKGIRTTADTTEKTRHESKKKAHDLLTKATSSLSSLLGGTASALHKAIGKI